MRTPPLPAEEARQSWREDGGRGRRERERSVEARGRLTATDGRAGDQPEERRRRAPPASQPPRGAEQRPHRDGEAASSEYSREARGSERQPPRYRESDRFRHQQQHREGDRRRDGPYSSNRHRGGARDLYHAPPKGPVPVEYGGPRPNATRVDTRKAA